jgi:hypothetical protein
LGFPTGWSFTTHKDHQLFFWRRCRGTKKNNLPHQLAAIKRSSSFSGAVAGEEVEDFCEGSFCMHILYFVIVLLYFIYFTCIVLYQKPKKNRILSSCFTYLLLVLLKRPILKTPSCVTLLAQTIVILSALLLHHLLLLQTFMRLSLFVEPCYERAIFWC